MTTQVRALEHTQIELPDAGGEARLVLRDVVALKIEDSMRAALPSVVTVLLTTFHKVDIDISHCTTFTPMLLRVLNDVVTSAATNQHNLRIVGLSWQLDRLRAQAHLQHLRFSNVAASPDATAHQEQLTRRLRGYLKKVDGQVGFLCVWDNAPEHFSEIAIEADRLREYGILHEGQPVQVCEFRSGPDLRITVRPLASAQELMPVTHLTPKDRQMFQKYMQRHSNE